MLMYYTVLQMRKTNSALLISLHPPQRKTESMHLFKLKYQKKYYGKWNFSSVVIDCREMK